MSWLFSRALVEEYSAGICLDGEPYALWNTTPTQPLSWLRGRTMDASRPFQFGMMFKPLTDDRGEGVLMSFLAAFPAKTSALQAKAQDSTAREADCGASSPASLAKFDRATSSWRTPQLSLFGDSMSSSVTWPRWGSMRNGECWERTMSVPRTFARGSGLWPTPRANSGNGAGIHGTGGMDLQTKVAMWPTPAARDCKGANSREHCEVNGTGRKHMDQLANAVAHQALRFAAHWPTPRTAGMCGGTGAWEMLNRATTKEEARAMGAGNGGQLNPTWVEWLMNWPMKWSDIHAEIKSEYQRWKKASAAGVQNTGIVRTMWWDKDPSQAPHGREHGKQRQEEHSDSMCEVPRVDSRERAVGGSYEDKDVSVLRSGIPVRAGQAENVQQGMREQTGLDEAPHAPRVESGVKHRVDRLKCIGNGQVPQVAALAWELLTSQFTEDQN